MTILHRLTQTLGLRLLMSIFAISPSVIADDKPDHIYADLPFWAFEADLKRHAHLESHQTLARNFARRAIVLDVFEAVDMPGGSNTALIADMGADAYLKNNEKERGAEA